MDPRFPASREELYNLQMEVKHVQCTQTNHAERILRLEKRHVDDSALKSVWATLFPGVLGGTPQQGAAVQIPHNGIFDELDEQGEQLLGSLHLGPAEEEPVRRGAASRANSVRFDESALHGSSCTSWGGQNNRHSGDFGPIRPGSGLMMERSLSHKSDGRHSSAGHSVHSHHSVASGRASSLGLDTNFAAGGDDDASSFEIPAPPVSLYVLGTVPSIVRCWLTTNFAHDTLLYADMCTGSQRSVVDLCLLKELDLVDEMEQDVDGVYRARLSMYLAEAVVTKHSSRNRPSVGCVPSMTVLFEVVEGEHTGQECDQKAIGIYVGSDALRAHSADLLFSQNKMVLFGNERDRLQVPFVRPEDDSIFRHISTVNMAPERPKLNANATPFVVGEGSMAKCRMLGGESPIVGREDNQGHGPISPVESHIEGQKCVAASGKSDHSSGSDGPSRDASGAEAGGRNGSSASEAWRRESSATTAGIWGPWRQGAGSGADGGPASGHKQAARSGRSMKVLRPLKARSTSAKTGGSYEPPVRPKSSEGRRKSQVSEGGGAMNESHRWDVRRTASSGTEMKAQLDKRTGATVPRSANPVGVASAFSWMTPSTKASKTSTGTGE